MYGHPDAAALVALGLHALQHRGQEAAGIVAYDGEQFSAHRGMGLVSDNFSSKEVIARLPGQAAIGHVRYATTGEVALRNVQPLFADFEFGGLAICHNGNLTNSYQLRRRLVRRGSLFQSTSDTEVIVHLIATSLKETVVDRLIDALRQVQGAYSLVALSQDVMIGVRDPLGVRPLVLGRLGDAWISASETCALDIIGADFVRDIAAGEIVIIGANGIESVLPFGRRESRFCVFEHIYFARPDSVVEGAQRLRGAQAHRPGARPREPCRCRHRRAGARFGRAGGARLFPGIGAAVRARDHPQPLCRPHLYRADRSDPPSRRAAEAQRQPRQSRGQARHPGRRFDRARHHLDQDRRDGAACRSARGAHADLEPADHAIPAITGSPRRSAISFSPRVTTSAAMAEYIGVDSLAFLSIDGLYRAMGEPGRDPLAPRFCDACFTGDYPIPLIDADNGKVSVQLSLLAEPA